jgi:hypothetical protein
MQGDGDLGAADAATVGHTPDPDDICRGHPDRTNEPCRRCGYVPAALPDWATHGAVFAVDGAAYRVVATGSTNRYAPRGLHFEETVSCERIGQGHWELPEAPCPAADVRDALGNLLRMPVFRAQDLTRALVPA